MLELFKLGYEYWQLSDGEIMAKKQCEQFKRKFKFPCVRLVSYVSVDRFSGKYHSEIFFN